MLTGRFFDVSGIPLLMPYDILETTKNKAITDTCLEKGEKIMTKADEMRKLAAQNQKPKTQKVDYYDEALRNVYFGQFYSDVQYCAQRGDSSGVGYFPCELRTPPHSDSDYDNGICVGKLYEDKIIGFFTTYHVITLTSLGERFLRDFRAKAEKDGFNITFKIYDGRSYYSFGEKIPVVYDRNCEGGKRPLRLVACFRY